MTAAAVVPFASAAETASPTAPSASASAADAGMRTPASSDGAHTGASAPGQRGRGAAGQAALELLAPLGPAGLRALQERIFDWHAGNRRHFPWRCTTDLYAILVSEVMLQQTQASRVVPKYEELMGAYPTLESLAAAATADVLRLWSGLGYNARAVRLQRAARAAVALGRKPAALPNTLAGLCRLPGVGSYTARAVLIFARNADLAAVDANVRRVLTHELGLPRDLPAATLQAVAEAVLPFGRSRDWHNALMDYGSLVLTSRRTGVAPRTPQGPFAGSRRWYRSRILKLLLEESPRPLAELAAALELPPGDLADLLAGLERDGLVVRRAAETALP